MSHYKTNPYPNSWYILRDGVPLAESVSRTKSYTMGYLNALCSFLPHPEYRLIDNIGTPFEIRHAEKAPSVEGGAK